jgi:tumor necrosis factor ligand superfamily protein 4
MEVQNNSVVIKCDGLYIIYLKGSFFQEVKIDLHFREDHNPISIPMLNDGRRIVFTVVASLAFKDKVYLTVNAPDTLCEHLQINDGELIVVQLTPGYCAPEGSYHSTVNQVPL